MGDMRQYLPEVKVEHIAVLGLAVAVASVTESWWLALATVLVFGVPLERARRKKERRSSNKKATQQYVLTRLVGFLKTGTKLKARIASWTPREPGIAYSESVSWVDDWCEEVECSLDAHLPHEVASFREDAHLESELAYHGFEVFQARAAETLDQRLHQLGKIKIRFQQSMN